MNQALESLAAKLSLNDPVREHLRLEFGYACVLRVKHFIEAPSVADCLFGLGQFLSGAVDRSRMEALAAQAARLTNQHQGSTSIDGAGHAAVSAKFAVANALAGKALQAAEYSAYAMVFGQGGYEAVADRESCEPEFQWQVETLSSLAGKDRGSCVLPVAAASDAGWSIPSKPWTAKTRSVQRLDHGIRILPADQRACAKVGVPQTFGQFVHLHFAAGVARNGDSAAGVEQRGKPQLMRRCVELSHHDVPHFRATSNR